MALNMPLWQANPIQYLINDKYPLNYLLKLQNLSNSSPKLDEATIREIAEFRKELEAKTQKEISPLVQDARNREAERLRQYEEKTEAEAFFSQPSSIADFTYWARISYWTLEEGVALSLGKNPSIVNSQKLTVHKASSPFIAKYAAKHEEVMRAKAMGQLWDSTIPFVFIKWARRVGFEMPEELTSRVLELGVQVLDWKEAYEEQVQEKMKAESELAVANQKILDLMGDHSKFLDKYAKDNKALLSDYQNVIEQRNQSIARLKQELATVETTKFATKNKTKADLGIREKESLLKLILGMAMKGYSFDPKASRSAQVQEIADDLLLVGLSLDADTVRKYLNEAKELFSDQLNRKD